MRVSFTPTLMPMSRGMQSTIYVKVANGVSVDDLRSHLQVCPQWLLQPSILHAPLWRILTIVQ